MMKVSNRKIRSDKYPLTAKNYENGSTRHKHKTFGSALAHNSVSTAVIQRLLKHSSQNLTNKVYTNVDPVLRNVVDQIPAGDWL